MAATARHYDTILSPVITEKTTLLSEQNKVVFKVANDATKDEIAAAVEELFKVKHHIKQLEEREEAIKTHIQKYMGEAEALGTFDGRILATWKSAKGSTKFNTDLFKTSMPEIYKQFLVEVPGSRRFLIK